MNGTFSGGTCCEQLGHAASRREFSRSVLFGMDEARRVTAASSHEIQSRIFAPNRSIFEGQHKWLKSQSWITALLICNNITSKVLGQECTRKHFDFYTVYRREEISCATTILAIKNDFYNALLI